MDYFKDITCYESNVDLKSKSILNIILNDFPLFFQHLFGFCNKDRKKWREISLNVKPEMISLVPNGLFTKQETIEAIISFLSKDWRMIAILALTLIEEKKRNYWVDLLPAVIFYSIFLNHPSTELKQYEVDILNIYMMNSSIVDKMVASEVKVNISQCVLECYNNSDNICSIVSKKLFNNSEFQDDHTSWEMFTFTTETCLYKTKIIRWSQIENIEKDQSSNEISLLYSDGMATDITSVQMKSKPQCEITFNVLQFQLKLMKPYYCNTTKKYFSRSCIKDHWMIEKLLNPSSSIYLTQLTSQDYCKPPHSESMGNNCRIKIVSLQLSFFNIQHVCIKELFEPSKFKEFWKMISIYRHWHHPSIMKFYGLVEGEFAIFREFSAGPLISYLFKGTNKAFSLSDIINVLNSIGNALNYLHNGLKQTYGNLNLQRVMIIDSSYKLCEPSLGKRIEGYLKSLKNLIDDLDVDTCSDERYDVLQILYCIISIFYINSEMYNEEICADSFKKTKCNNKLKNLINKWLSGNHNIECVLEDLKNTSFTDDEMNCIIVPPKNKCIPNFLMIVARDANMYDVTDIEFNKLKIKSHIGRGHFSDVYSAEYQSPNDGIIQVAMKKFKTIKETHIKELRTSTMVLHQNVLKSIGFSKDNDIMYLITELGESSLLSYLKKINKNITDEMCLDFSMQVCKGMQFISDDNKIIHRDLAARNVIIFPQKNKFLLKISDFGLTILLDDDKDYYKSFDPASKVWLPPDDIMNHKYSLKTDIYSFGVLMWEIYSRGQEPSSNLRHYLGFKKEYEIIMKCHSIPEDNRPNNFEAVMELLKNLL